MYVLSQDPQTENRKGRHNEKEPTQVCNNNFLTLLSKSSFRFLCDCTIKIIFSVNEGLDIQLSPFLRNGSRVGIVSWSFGPLVVWFCSRTNYSIDLDSHEFLYRQSPSKQGPILQIFINLQLFLAHYHWDKFYISTSTHTDRWLSFSNDASY